MVRQKYGGEAEAGRGSESIFVRSDYMLVRVELKDSLLSTHEGLHPHFTEDEPHPVMSHMMMKTIEDLLPANEFIRVHRSYIVH